MGKPKFSRKKYETPQHPWQEERIKEENEIIKKYGLKNKKEIWKAETKLRRYRGQARELLASVETGDKQSKKESKQLLNSLNRMNILPVNSTLDDVLALEIESILSRRLQTIAYLKGFASTPKQSRQLISHGHIAVGKRKVTIPSYMVTKEEENNISYIDASPLNDSMHPARPKSDYTSRPTSKKPIKPKDKKEEKIEEKKPVEKPEEEKKPEEKQKDEQTAPKEEQKPDEKPKEEKTEEEKKPEEKQKDEQTAPKEEKTEDIKQEMKTEKKEEVKRPQEKIKEEKKPEEKAEPKDKDEKKDSKAETDEKKVDKKEEIKGGKE